MPSPALHARVAWGARAARPRRTKAKGRAGRAAEAAAAAAAPALTFGEQMLAGAVARGVAQTVLHPVDVVRTRLQAQGVSMQWRAGVFAKGILPQVLLASPAGALQFLGFEAAKKQLAELDDSPKSRELRMLTAGAAGSLLAAVCRVPQEVLKQRIQADIYPNLAVAFRETIRTGGVPGLYKGALATISRDVPWNALSFMFHGRAKVLFAAVKRRAPEDGENLVLAGISGAMAAVIMTPVDVVKTRLMTQRLGVTKYSGIVGTLKTIVREEGAGTLMRGVVPRVMFLAPLAGITFSLYEVVAGKIRERKAAKGKVARAQDAARHRRGRASETGFIVPRFRFAAL
jgi:solute carrier family 25 (mitochondrial S-adenosylmethionine transporter), member 26